MARSTYEPILNYKLSQLLASEGLEVTAEELGGGRKRFDIRVRIEDMDIAREGEKGSRAGALRDAQDRLDQSAAGMVIVDRTVAINYPAGLSEDQFDESTVIQWAVLPSRDFTEGNVALLVDTLRALPQDHGNASRLVTDIDQTLERAVNALHIEQIRDLAEAMNLPLRHKGKDKSRVAAKRALLVVLAAAMFHARLDNNLRNMKPQIDARRDGDAFTDAWPPARLIDCAKSEDVIGALQDAWSLVLALD